MPYQAKSALPSAPECPVWPLGKLNEAALDRECLVEDGFPDATVLRVPCPECDDRKLITYIPQNGPSSYDEPCAFCGEED